MLKRSEKLTNKKEFESTNFSLKNQPISIIISSTLASDDQSNSLEKKLNETRNSLLRKIGVKIPSVEIIVDSNSDGFHSFEIQIHGSNIFSGAIPLDKLIVFSDKKQELPFGDKLTSYESNSSFFCIEPSFEEEALQLNFQSVSLTDYLCLQVAFVSEDSLFELITLEDIKQLLDSLKEKHPTLVDEISRKGIELSFVRKVIQALFQEKTWIKDVPLIFECILEFSNEKYPDHCVTLIREKALKQLTNSYRDQNGNLSYIAFSSSFEKKLSIHERHDGYHCNLDSHDETFLIETLHDLHSKSEPFILVVGYNEPNLRPAIARLLRKYKLNIPVFSPFEISSCLNTVKIETIGKKLDVLSASDFKSSVIPVTEGGELTFIITNVSQILSSELIDLEMELINFALDSNNRELFESATFALSETVQIEKGTRVFAAGIFYERGSVPQIKWLKSGEEATEFIKSTHVPVVSSDILPTSFYLEVNEGDYIPEPTFEEFVRILHTLIKEEKITREQIGLN